MSAVTPIDGASASPASSADPPAPSVVEAESEVQRLAQLLRSQDESQQLDATRALRKLLSKDDTTIPLVIDAGLLPRLVEFCGEAFSTALQVGDSSHADTCTNRNGQAAS